MFDRLIGMETEYALRFRPREAGAAAVGNAVLFDRLLEHLRSKLPVVPSIINDGFGPHSWFLANGGAVRFERILFFFFLPRAGLVEGMTPECRGPRQLLTHQRAQDALLSQAAAASAGELGQATLVKNNRDSHGNSYGSHENYEAAVAAGATLFFWKLGLILLPALIVLAIPIEIVIWIMVGFLGVVTAIMRRLFRHASPLPVWEVIAPLLLDFITLPIRLIGGTFARLTAFRPQRRRLVPFLVSRPIIAGAGALDANGRFSLSARAWVIGSVCGVAIKGYRPIFLFNHVLNNVFRLFLGDGLSYRRLFGERQRLQLGIGDANMTQLAEFLKIGTTLLVLDAIEAGALEDEPRLKRPLRALRAICDDPTLQTTVPLRDGQQWTALQVQRWYLEACRRFVERSEGAPEEARVVLDLWEETLDALERDPNELVGKLDWVTKRYLLDEAGRGAALEARRKIDLRYHELSQAGYYLQLESAGAAPTLVEPEEVLRATTVPPEGTPATLRGQLIRDYAGWTYQVRASWSSAIIGTGRAARAVRFP